MEIPNTTFSKKTLFIIFIAIVFLIAITASVVLLNTKFKRTPTAENQKPKASPPAVQKQAQLVSALPYKTDNFLAEYFPSGFFIFTIHGGTTENVEKAKQDVYNWVLTFDGFDKEKICTIKYDFIFANLKGEEENKVSKTFPGCSKEDKPPLPVSQATPSSTVKK